MDTDTEVMNDTLETSTPEPGRNTQFHRALNHTTTCLFQCKTREEPNRHIERIHNTKPQLQWTVCMKLLRDLDPLAYHMNMEHKDKNPYLKCNIFGEHIDGENEEHIENEHTQTSNSEQILKFYTCQEEFLD